MSAGAEQRKPAGMFTDVVGYSALSQRDASFAARITDREAVMLR